MTGRAKLAVLGGTFDHLHAGHWRLLDTAFARANRVGIGITTDRFLALHPKEGASRLEPFARRRRHLESLLRARYPQRRWWTVALEDLVGGALAPEVEMLVASADTRPGAQIIQRARRRRRLPPLHVVYVPLVAADDLLPISSTRIRRGAIRADGRREGPILLARERGLDPEVAGRLEIELRRIFPPRASLRWVRRARPRIPASHQGSRRRRAEALAIGLRESADYGFGLVARSDTRMPPRDPIVVVADADGPIGGPARRRSGSLEGSLRRQFRERKRRWTGVSNSSSERPRATSARKVITGP
ncbi:MAG: pantetheine-phosphate adenylyltransferase [Thermoplasmata archaeon]|nr:pantetheine-phosphate adenylyltransferase [Thermoplasmata archaeon]